MENEIVRQLERHISVIENGEVLVAITDNAFVRFGNVIQEKFGSTKQVEILVGADASSSVGDYSLIVVVAENPNDARSEYAKFERAKSKNIPTAQVCPGRTIVMGPGNWQGSGITYQGMFWLAAQYIRTLRPTKGAYCEFGVYDGRSFAMAGHALKNVCGSFIAYDSYRGIGGTVEEERQHFGDGQYSANISTLEHNLLYAGLRDLNYRVVPGFFQETLKDRTSKDDGIGPIAMVHIDVDVYEPAYLALEYISPDLQDGALILFDDYDQIGASNEVGERRALREWLQNHDDFTVEPYREYGVFCRSFIFHRNNK